MIDSKVQHAWIPSHLSTYYVNMFYNCSELETVLMADHDPGEMAKNVVIQSRAFASCPKLCRVEVPALSARGTGVAWF